jgi:DNA-binding transcriptional ArsR family regulator
MIERLTRGEATLSDLAGPLAMSLPAAHQHLAVLEGAGLVRSEKRGRQRWCRLDEQALTLAETWIRERRRLWNARLDALGAFLAEAPKKPRRRRTP